MPRKKKVIIPTHLTNEEMLRIDLYNKQAECDELKRMNLLLKKDLLINKIEREIVEAGQVSLKSTEKRKKFNQEIKERFEIEKDKWGYDPLTGEVK